MDFLDTNKIRREKYLLFTGYILIAVAILIATFILVNLAYGYNVNDKGSVIQNGLVYFSSEPNPANIYLNGKLQSQTTNTSLLLPSGIYNVKLTRSGYRNWNRVIAVNGGSVENFDYPFLYPKTLKSTSIGAYDSAPGFMTQSPNYRYILIEQPGSLTNFDLYDLKNEKKPVESTITLPTNILSTATTSQSQSLQVIGWSDDNQHVLLEHLYDGKYEYILLNTQNPTLSLNLNNVFDISPTTLNFDNKKYNNFYAYNASTQELDLASLNSANTGTITPEAEHVISYQSYGNNTLLYVTSEGAPSGKVNVEMDVSDTIYKIRTLPISSTYLLNLTSYAGVPYIVIGSTAGSRVYIYQDPVSQITNDPKLLPGPIWVMDIPSPNYLSFSNNAQFVMVESGTYFAIYDLRNNLGYSYNNPSLTLDSPQQHVNWMDGDRVVYVSKGTLVSQEYDDANIQKLVSTSGMYEAAFAYDYKYLYTLSPAKTAGQYNLEMTPLLTPADL